MEQIESFNHLSISCREHSHASYCSYSEMSELTQMLDNEAEEPTPGSYVSSPESTPIMTPETSDDEEEDGFQLPTAGYESSEEAEPLLDVLVASSEQHGDKDPPHTSAATLQNLSNEMEGLHFSKGNPVDLEDETTDPFSTPAAQLESSEDEDASFHDAELASELYYGVLLSLIRQEDRTTLEKINPPTSREPRSRMRIYRELKSLHEDESVPYLSVAPIDGNLRNCLACMEGAPETPHQGGIFWLHIDFPEDYPVKAPVVRLLTPVYHPNIDEHGRICINILEDAWSPCLQTRQVLLSILSVLHSPIVDDEALVPGIAEKYLLDNDDYCDIVRVYTASASGSRPDTSTLINLTSVDSVDSSENPYQIGH